MTAIADATSEKVRCPKCGRDVDSLQCGHCGSRLPIEQADLYGAVARQLARMGGTRSDTGNQGGSEKDDQPTGNSVHGKRFTRPGDDFYPTPPEAVEALLRCEDFDGPIWEPACGDGAISKILIARGHEVHSSDKVDRGYGEVADFLETKREARHIATNPPYNQAEAFIEHALKCATGKVAMLLRLAFLEGQERYEKWMRWPLKTVWVFSKRISMYPDKHQTGHGLYPYAWFLWDHSHYGPPEIGWISPELMLASAESSRRKGQRRKRVWPSAPNSFALHKVEHWKKCKLTATEESLRRFFADKSWLVGGPIPLRLLYGADSMSLFLNDDQHNGLRRAGDLLGQDVLEQLTEEMRKRDIDEKYHGGLALLYLRLCRGMECPSEQAV
jgi:hypothetical protein